MMHGKLQTIQMNFKHSEQQPFCAGTIETQSDNNGDLIMSERMN